MKDELLTIQQAAKILGVSTKTLRRWEAKGILTPQRTIGNQRRYSKTELTTLFQKEKSKIQPAATTPAPVSETPIIVERAEEEIIKIDPVVSEVLTPFTSEQPLATSEETPLYFKATQFSGAILGMVLFLVITLLFLGSQQITNIFHGTMAMLISPKGQQLSKANVLGANDRTPAFQLQVNLPEFFGKKVTFLDNVDIKKALTVSGGITTDNSSINAGKGKITASNVVYSVLAGSNISITGDKQNPRISLAVPVSSVQGSTGAINFTSGTGISLNGLQINNTGVLSVGGATGDVTLTGGSGISVLGTTISNSDTGSSQNIFKTITAGGTDILASSNNDQLTFAAGSGIIISGSSGSKTITIASSGSGSIGGSGTTNYLPKFTSSSGVGNSSIYDNGQVGIGTTSPQGLFSVSGGLANSALVSLNNTSSQDILTGSESGATRFAFDANGNLNISGAYAVGGITGLSQGTASCVTTTGGIVTGFGTCQLGSEQWVVSNGSIYTGNPSLDFILGGTSTASARFGILNVSGGTPTASIAGSLANTATYLAGDGTLGTVNKETLTIGSASTGNIVLGTGTSAIALNLGSDAAGDIYYRNANGTLSRLGIGSQNQILTVNGSGLPSWTNAGGTISFWQNANGVLSPLNITDDLAIGGTGTASALFQISGTTGNATTSGIFTFGGTTAQLQSENGRTLTLGGNNTGNVVIDSAGTIALTATGANIITGLDLSVNGNITGAGTTGLSLIGSNAGIGFSGSNNHIISTSSGTLEIDGFKLLGDITGNGQNITGLGVISATGGNSTNWNQAFSNEVTSWNAPLSFSSNAVSLNYNATNLTLTSNKLNTIQDIAQSSSPTFGGLTITGNHLNNAALLVSQTGSGDLFTASAGATTRFTVSNNGNISFTGGMNFLTTLASSASAAQTVYVPDLASIGGSDSICFVALGNCAGTGNSVTKSGTNTNGQIAYFTSSNNITSNSNFLFNNSLSVTGANGGMAAVIINQQNSGDIFSASSSGTPVFTLAHDGTITDAKYTGDNAVLFGTAGTGVIAAVGATSTGGQCLLSGTGTAAPTWGPCDIGNSSWIQANGTIYPGNATEDLLVGGTATTSAKFALTGVSTNTPVASLSGSTGSTFLTAAGNLATMDRQTLALGGGGSGNISLQDERLVSPVLLTQTAISLDAGLGTNGIIDAINKAYEAAGGSGAGGVWTLSGNVIYPSTIANQVGLGTTAVGNGEFVVNQPNTTGDIIAASTSAGTQFVVAHDGSVAFTGGSNFLQTLTSSATHAQTLTIPDFGGGSTQICLVAAGNCAGSGTSVTHTNGAAGQIAYFDSGNDITGSSNFLFNNSLSVIGANGGMAAAIINQQNSGDIFSASSSGLTKFTIAHDGTITDAKYAGGSNSILYADANGVITTQSTGTPNQCLLSGASTPTWGACDVGNSSWVQANGTIYPGNSTEDLLVGGTSTSSAKFAFMNVAGSNTPTASISGTGNNALSLTGNGTIGTTNGQSLTLGTTGNVNFFSSANVLDTAGNLKLAGNILAGTYNGLTVTNNGGGTLSVANTKTLTVNGSTTLADNQITFGGTETLTLTAARNVAFGDAFSTSNAITLTGAVGGSTVTLPSSGTLATLTGTETFSNKTLDNTNSIILKDSNFTLENAADITKKLTFDLSGITAGQTRTLTIPDASGTICLNTNNCGYALGTNYWQLNTNAISPANSIYDFLLGGTSTASAKFAFLNNAGGTPTASISAQNGVGTTGVVVNGNGSLQALNNNTLTLGGNSTGNIVLSPNNGGSSGAVNVNAGITNFSGFVGINLAGSNPISALNVDGVISVGGASSALTLYSQDLSGKGMSLYSTAENLAFSSSTLGVVGEFAANGSFGLGLNNINPLAELDVRATSATIPVASVSGASTFANVVVDQSGLGDIFTASKSGATKFTINNKGNLQLNNYTANGGVLYTDALGNVMQTPAGSGGEVLALSGSTPVWESAGAAGLTFWQTNGNALSPFDITSDLLLGGTSTSSAKFAFLNNAGGIPVASISAQNGVGTTGIVANGNGSLQSLNNNTLTVGGTTTGNIVLSPLNGLGNVTISSLGTGILQANNSGVLSSSAINLGTIGSNYITGILPVLNGGSPFNEGAGSIFERNTTEDLLLGSNATTSAVFAFINVAGGTPTASIASGLANNSTAYLSGTGVLGTTNAQTLQLGSSSTGNVSLMSRGTMALTAVGGNVGIGTATPSAKLQVVGGDTSSTSAAFTVTDTLNKGDVLAQVKDDGEVGLGEATMTLGNTSTGNFTGSNYWNGSQELLQAQSFITTSGGTIKSISTYIGSSVDATHNAYQFGIYQDVGGAPGTLLAQSSVGTLTATAWNTLPITYTLAPNTKYWFVYWTNVQDASNNSQNFIQFYTGSNVAYQGHAAWGSGAMPGTFPAGSSVAGYEVSMYASFTNPVSALTLDASGNLIESGNAVFQPIADSTTAFQVNNATGTQMFGVDTANGHVSINNANNFANLNVAGNEEITGSNANALRILNNSSWQAFNVNSTTGVTTLGNVTSTGGTGLAGSLVFADGTADNFGGTIATTTLTGSRNYTLPDASGTICVSGQTCATTGVVGYFQRNSGVLSPANITDDLLLGGTATASARFAFTNNIGIGTPTASISANSGANATYLTGAGVLGTTNAQTLTLGSTSTGNIALNPNGSSVASFSTINNGTFTLNNINVSGDLFTVSNFDPNPQFPRTLFQGGQSTGDTNWEMRFSDAYTSQSHNLPAGIQLSTNNDSNYTNANSISLLATDSQALIYTTAGSSNNGVPIELSTYQTGDVSTPNLYLGTAANGYQVGIGTKTMAAQLDVRGNVGTNPIASFSGTTTNASLIVDQSGTGDIFTASVDGAMKFTINNAGNLVFGGGSNTFTTLLKISGPTNNRTISLPDNSGVIALATSGSATNGTSAFVQGGSNWGSTTAVLGTTSNGALQFETNNVVRTNIDTSGNLSIGANVTAAPALSTLDVRGITGTTPTASFSGSTTNAEVIVDQSGVGDLFTASKSGAAKFVIQNNGNIEVSNGTSLVAGVTNTGLSCASVVNGIVTGTGSCVTGNTSFVQANGAIYEGNTTQDLLLGGTATSSAKFAFINIAGSATPIASISAGTPGGVYLSANGILATTAKQSFVLGDANTGNINIGTDATARSLSLGNNQANTAVNITGGSIGGINLSGPTTVTGTTTINTTGSNNTTIGNVTNGAFSINAGAASTMSFGNSSSLAFKNSVGTVSFYTLNPAPSTTGVTANTFAGTSANIGSAANATYTTFAITPAQVTFTGTTTITSLNSGTIINAPSYTDGSANTLTDASTLTLSGAAQKGGNLALTNAYGLKILNGSTSGATNGYGLFVDAPNGSTNNYAAVFNTGAVGIGTTAPVATLDIHGNLATTPTASLSGATTFANTVIDQSGSGDLFTASKSGATKFTISNAGNIIAPNYAGNNAILYANPTTGLFSAATTNTANQCLLSGAGNTPTWGTCPGTATTTIEKTSDQSVNNSTTLVNDNQLVFSVGSNQTWTYQMVVYVNEPNITPGLTLEVTGPAGATCTYGTSNSDSTGSTALSCGTGPATYVLSSGSPYTYVFFINGSVTTGATAGNVQLKWAQNTATAVNTTVKAGSFLTAEQTGTSNTNPANFINNGNSFGTTALLGTNDANALELETNNTVQAYLGTNGSFGLGTTNPFATLDVRGNVATIPVASFSGATTNAGLIVDNSGTGNLFTASKSGASKFTVLNNGNLQLNNYTASNGVLYTNSTGVLQQLTTGTPNLCLLSGASTPTWGNCVGGNTTWQEANGAIYAGNTTEDLLIGGASSGSAEFSFTGVANNTPIASIAATPSSGTSNGLVLNGATNTIQSLNRYTLTLGGSTTGDISFQPGGVGVGSSLYLASNGNVGIGTSAPGDAFDLIGNTNTNFKQTIQNSSIGNSANAQLNISNQSGKGLIQEQYANANSATWNGITLGGYSEIRDTNTVGGMIVTTANALPLILGTNDTQRLYLDSSGNVGIGSNFSTVGAKATLDVRGTSGTTPDASISGNTTFAGLVVDQSGTGDIFTASVSGLTKFVINNAGNVGVGTTTPTALLDVAGTASVSGQLALYGTPQIQSTANQTLTVGGSTTGNISFQPGNVGAGTSLYLASSGNVGIGTATPIYPMEVSTQAPTSGNGYIVAIDGSLKGTNSQNSLAVASTINPTSASSALYTGGYFSPNAFSSTNLTSAKVYAIKGVPLYSGGGNLASMTGGYFNSTISGGGTVGNVYGLYIDNPTINSGTVTNDYGLVINQQVAASASANNVNAMIGGTGAYTGGIYSIFNGSTSKNYFGGLLGIGATAPQGTLDVRALSGTLPVASLSGATTNAALLVDNSGSGDLFTASSSGLTRFVINQNGNVGIGTTNPTGLLTVNQTGSSDLLDLQNSGNNVATISNTGATVFQNSTGADSKVFFQIKKGGGPTVFDVDTTDLYVGIGTVSPHDKLDISGNATVSGNLTFYNGARSIQATQNQTLTVGGGTTGDIAFQPGGQAVGNSLYLASNGNVGIGTSTPGVKLGIIGDTNGQAVGPLVVQAATVSSIGTAVTLDSTPATGGHLWSFISTGSTAAAGGGHFSFLDGTANAYRMDIDPNGRVGIGTANFNQQATLDVRGNSGVIPAASISGNTSFASLLVDNSGVGDLFTASKSGAAKFVIQNNGNIEVSNGTSLVAGVTNTGLSCASVVNGIVTGTGSCVTGNTSFVQANGAIYEGNTTQDLLLGGTSTSSAKFAFINVAGSNTPTASISGANNNALSLTATGTIQTTNGQSLLLNPNGFGNVGIGLSSPAYPLSVNGSIQSTGNHAALKLMAQDNSGNSYVLYSASGDLTFYSPNGPGIVGDFRQGGRLGLGVNNTSPLAQLDVQGTSTGGGIVPIASFSGQTSFAGLVVDNSGSGDLFTASKSGATKFVIANNGNVGVGLSNPGYLFTIQPTINGQDTFVVNQAGSNNPGLDFRSYSNGGQMLFYNGTSVETLINGAGASYFDDGLTVGTNFGSNVAVLDVRGANDPNNGLINAGTIPSASISAQSSAASLVVDQSGKGDIFTASSSGMPRFTIQNNGNVFVSNQAQSAFSATGMLNILPSGIAQKGLVIQGLSGQSADLLDLYGSSGFVSGYDASGNEYLTGTLNLQGSSGGFIQSSTNKNLVLNFNSGTFVGIGTTTATNFGDAELAVNQQNAGGDIFTASQAGATKFTINNAGNIIAPNYAGSNAVLFAAAGTGTFATATTGSTGLCLVSGASTPGWTTCGATGLWNQNLGAIYAGNTTEDLLLGGTATNSADFAITGIDSINPTASISAFTNGGNKNGLALSSTNATIQSLNRNTLTIGGNTTGDIALQAGGTNPDLYLASNGNVGIGTTTPGNLMGFSAGTATIMELSSANNPVFGLLSTGNHSPQMLFGSNNSYSGAIDYTGNGFDILTGGINPANEHFVVDQNGQTGFGFPGGVQSTNLLATLDARDIFGTTPTASFSGKTSFANLVVDQSGSGDLFTASVSGLTKFTITNAGNVNALGNVGIGRAASSLALDINGFAASNVSFFADSAGSNSNCTNINTAGCNGYVLGNTGSHTGFISNISGTTNVSGIDFVTNGSTKMSLTTGGALGIGTTSPVATLDVRGNSATLPIASFSGSTNFAGMVVNNSGSGDLFTASSAGRTKFTIRNDGSIIFGGDTITASASGATNNGSPDFINGLGDTGSLVPNASFEASTSAGLGFADMWVKAASSSGALSVDNVTVAHGSNSIKVNLAANGSAAFYSACFPVSQTSGSNYDIGAYTRSSTGTNPTIWAYVDSYSSKANCVSNTGNSISALQNLTPGATGSFQFKESSSFGVGGTWGRVHFFIASAVATAINVDAVRFLPNLSSNGLDYAEDYPADPHNIPTAGQVVMLEATSSAAQVAPANKPMDSSVIGVVSTKPGEELNDGTVPSPYVPVALAGRIPVNVSTANGPIHVGDYLTSSDIPGVAVKATGAGPVIGNAMEDDTNIDTTAVKQITVFVKNSYYNGQSYVDAGSVTISHAAPTPGTVTDSPAFELADKNGNIINQTGVYSDAAIGNLKAGGINAQQINTQDLILAGQSVNDRLNNLENTASGEAQVNNKIDTLSDSLRQLQDKVATLEGTVNLLASGSALLTNNPFSLTASSSAELNLDKLTINTALSVLGKTTVADLGVTGHMTVGLLAIDGLDASDGSGNAFATLNTSAGPFKIQSEGINGVDFENGKLTIDTDGNLQSQGAVTATKYDVDNSAVAGASLGTAMLPAGDTSIVINTTAVTNKSAIFVTPRTKTSEPLSVTTQTAGKSFKVEINSPSTVDIKFNWWIVN